LVKHSKGFFSFSDSVDFFSTETAELEVLGLAPVSEGVLKVADPVVEASEIVGETVSSADDTGAGADKLVEAEMLEPNDDVVEEVEVASAVVDETAVVVLLSVMTVVVETAVELSELADSVDAAAAADDAAVEAAAGMWVVFLATTALYCCISITAASSNTWMFRRHRIRASTAVRS